jgi:PUA domain protein
VETKRRQFLREREAAALLQEFSDKIKIDVRALFDAKKLTVEVAEGANVCIYYLDGRPLAARLRDVLVPTLLFDRALLRLPKIVVNMGAVPHICNGADVLAPGMVKIDGAFGAGDYVLVVDERHGKPLAVVSALVDSVAASGLSRGKVALNLHYVGDDLWNVLRKA